MADHVPKCACKKNTQEEAFYEAYTVSMIHIYGGDMEIWMPIGRHGNVDNNMGSLPQESFSKTRRRGKE